MVEVIINISNRRLVNIEDLKTAFRNLKDGKHIVTVKDYRKRSLPQNAYYWSVMVPMIRDGLYNNGFDDVTDNEDAHEVIKMEFLTRRIVSKQTGDVKDIYGSTTKLSITEFNQFIEKVCKWAAEYLGVNIPSPNEELVLFAEYNSALQESIV